MSILHIKVLEIPCSSYAYQKSLKNGWLVVWIYHQTRVVQLSIADGLRVIWRHAFITLVLYEEDGSSALVVQQPVPKVEH